MHYIVETWSCNLCQYIFLGHNSSSAFVVVESQGYYRIRVSVAIIRFVSNYVVDSNFYFHFGDFKKGGNFVFKCIIWLENKFL